jgi:putative transposase
MAKSRFTHDQRTAAILEIDAGCALTAVSRKYGVSKTTLYRWRSKLAEQRNSAVDRLRSLELENRRLKSKFAELALDYTSLRTALVGDVKREC